MKIELLQIGKTTEEWLKSGIDEYEGRIRRMSSFEIKTLPETKIKGIDIPSLKNMEGKGILKSIEKDDFVMLLDERGTMLTSKQLARWIEQKQMTTKKIVFVIGGAYGFSDEIYRRSNFTLSLSPMTFSHQLVRLVFMEQLYRAFTIIKGLPYHHA